MKAFSDPDALPAAPNPVKMFHFLSVLLIIPIITEMVSCVEPMKRAPELVKFFGNSVVSNYSKDYYLFFTKCHPAQPGALMAANGDILLTENWMLQLEPGLKDLEGNIHFIDSDSMLLINGKTVAIALDSFSQMEKLIDIHDKSALKNVHMLQLSQTGFEQNKAGITKIAAVNRKCNLALTGPFEDSSLQMVLDLFDPGMLFIELPESQQNLLSTEKQLEVLIISSMDSMYTCSPLPSFPNLHTFSFQFDGDDIEKSDSNKYWLKNNPQIKTLVLTDWNENYPAGLLSYLSGPETLIMGGMEIPDTEITAHKNSLKRLITDHMQLQLHMPHVQWLTIFDDDSAQSLLQQIANEKPDCKVLEIVGIDTTLDIHPLQRLKHLEVLTIVESDSINLDVVKQMKQLKMLSYGSEELNTDSTVKVLQAALPNTVVVSNEGLCMGSGWLLLLLPFSALAIWLAKIRLHTEKNAPV